MKTNDKTEWQNFQERFKKNPVAYIVCGIVLLVIGFACLDTMNQRAESQATADKLRQISCEDSTSSNPNCNR